MSDRFKLLAEAAQEFSSWATSDQPRIPFGFPVLDSRSNGGPAQGEVVFFVSRPSVGKTTFAINVIRNNPHVPTVFFSIEMHGRYVASRLAAMTHNVSTRQIEAHPKLVSDILAQYPNLGIADNPSTTFDEMNDIMDEATDVLAHRPRLVVVDYLELIHGMGKSAVEDVDRVAVEAKAFARRHDVVLLVLHQVSRGEGGNGELALGLRSGRYGGEQAADYFLAAYRPCLQAGISTEEYRMRQQEWYLQFLKNRAGGDIHPVGVLHYLDPISMRISDKPHTQDITTLRRRA